MNKGIIIFAKQLNEELTKIGQYGTAKWCDCSVRSFLKFIRNTKLDFSDLNQSLLKEYEQYLLNTRRTRNTAFLFLKVIGSICNRTTDRLKTTIPSEGLFLESFSGMGQSEQRSPSLQFFAHLAKPGLGNKYTSLEFACYLFMLLFHLIKIPFDLANLCKEDAYEGMLRYHRCKPKLEVVTGRNC